MGVFEFQHEKFCKKSKMLAQKTPTLVQQAWTVFARRNLGISAVAYDKVSDPIQKLFLDKLGEYTKKSKAAGGGMVDVTPETQANLKRDLERLCLPNNNMIILKMS